MPVKKVRGGWKAGSYITGKWFKRLYKTKAAAERRAATSKRRKSRSNYSAQSYARKRKRY